MADVDLRHLSFFEGFEESSLAKVAELGELVEVDAGAVIIDQGDVGREAFVVQHGEVEIIVNGQTVATASEGSLLGEMALLDRRPRSARIVAITDCTLVSFDSSGFRQILEGMPAEERDRIVELDARFRRLNEDIAYGDRPRPITG